MICLGASMENLKSVPQFFLSLSAFFKTLCDQNINSVFFFYRFYVRHTEMNKPKQRKHYSVSFSEYIE